jgi:hypothetical protein
MGSGAMSRRVIIRNDWSRDLACSLVLQAPAGYICEVREATRSGEQNDKMWAMLTDLSVAKPEGRRLIPEDWKVLMMHACGWECQFLEGLDGRPFPKGFSSSKLTKGQMASLITFIQEYGDRHSVAWSEPKEQQ